VEPEDKVDEPFAFPEFYRPRTYIGPKIGLFDIVRNLDVGGTDNSVIVFRSVGNDSLLLMRQ